MPLQSHSQNTHTKQPEENKKPQYVQMSHIAMTRLIQAISVESSDEACIY
jgi:hypothetical protein